MRYETHLYSAKVHSEKRFTISKCKQNNFNSKKRQYAKKFPKARQKTVNKRVYSTK